MGSLGLTPDQLEELVTRLLNRIQTGATLGLPATPTETVRTSGGPVSWSDLPVMRQAIHAGLMDGSSPSR